jgi:hypothetical protein
MVEIVFESVFHLKIHQNNIFFYFTFLNNHHRKLPQYQTYTKSVCKIMVEIVFQSIFHLKIHQNNIFLIFDISMLK